MRKSSVLTLALIFSIVTVLVSSTSPISITAGKSSTTTVYFDQPTINGTKIGVNQTIKVNIMIRGAVDVFSWQAGLRFNATLLKCNFFKQGTFLSSVGSTLWLPGNISNTEGVIDAHACLLLGHGNKKSGSGILGYLNFTVKALGVSDLHLRDVEVRKEVGWETVMIPSNIIDVYTVVVNATVHKVVTVSNSTSFLYIDFVAVHSGFYDHAYNPTLKAISFKVTGPYPGWSNVTIPKALLQPEPQYVWTPIIDGSRLSIEERTVTNNLTHYSIYFKYSLGVHQIQITTRFMSSTILTSLSATPIILESNITISGNITASNPIDPARPNVTVTILYRLSGETAWTTLASVKTNQTSDYNYTWMPENVRTYEFKASWGGDSETLGDESDIQTLVVQPIPPSIYVFPADGYYVVIESNSTVFDFAFNATLNEVSFNVSRPYGDVYFSNVTIPRPLMWADNLDEWAVTIDGGRLDTEERTVTTNTTHSSVYFTYTPGDHKIQITTRFVLSNITIDLSTISVILESSVTISGNIDPVRSGVTVTIMYRSVGETAWTFLANATTTQFSNYSHVWTPENVGTYEVMASWEGDSETLGDESDIQTLVVQPIPPSIYVFPVGGYYVVIESNSTIFDFAFNDALNEVSFNVSRPYSVVYFSKVTVPKELLGVTYEVTIDGNYTVPTKTGNETHTSLYFSYPPGNYKVKIKGSLIQIGSTISIALSEDSITLDSSVTISGNIDPVRSGVTVTIMYRSVGETAWTFLANATTTQFSNYSHVWTPENVGTYEVMASWEGDSETLGDETDPPYPTLTVEKASEPEGIDLSIVVVIAVAIIVMAAIAVYFLKFRKPKS